MRLKQYKDYFKTSFNWNEAISIGKIDNNKEKAICFYNSKRVLAYDARIGGNKNRSTKIKPISILLKYTKNQDSAETKAQEIYDFFNEKSFYIDNKRIFVKMLNDDPISLGTDENGYYEYSIELNFYEEI